jgi:DNA-binding CsgD family transcriptional regulator
MLEEAGDDPFRASDDLVPAVFLLHSRGRLRLARGETREGLADLLECGSRLEAWEACNPGLIAWRSQAALALESLGDHDEALRLAQREVALAREFESQRELGIALRALGLIQQGDRGVELEREAVEVLSQSFAVLEHARALTDLGGMLRRRGRRSDARDPLRKGLDIAHRMGARALASRAHAELLAAGARPRRLTLSGAEALTPRQRKVAELAANGLTNREIAASLFVTEKTVEFHLSNAYSALSIGSRAELAGALELRGNDEAVRQERVGTERNGPPRSSAALRDSVTHV